jgi:biotin carboxylase
MARRTGQTQATRAKAPATEAKKTAPKQAAPKKTAPTTQSASRRSGAPKATAVAKKAVAKKAVAKKAVAKKSSGSGAATTQSASAKKSSAKKSAGKKSANSRPAAAKKPHPPKLAPKAESAASRGGRAPMRGVSEIRHFFRTNTTPVFFVGATPFNLLGLDRWVRNFHYVTYYDAWDGDHPRVFSPRDKPYIAFESGEEINNYLLRHDEVRAYMSRQGRRPKVAMVFFDQETEAICDELGYDLILPSAELREHLDSKIVTTRLGNEAGAPSVPNVMGDYSTWQELMTAAAGAGLGADLVVQTPYGDSGKTTFFIAQESDWDRHADDIVGQQAKVMKRINHRALAVEAVLTRHGTIVGPFMTELTGHRELTPYQGGWCGNEMFPTALTPRHRTDATRLVRNLGERLGQEGYRGFFEVDILIDVDDNEVYLGELNPRISGASAITNVTAGAYSDLPLFLFHLLEYMGAEYELDVEEINERWEALASVDLWSQMIIKETADLVERITSAPETGQWYFGEDGQLAFRRASLDWHQLQNESECFYLRIYGPGDYRWKGADLGVLVTKGRLQMESVDPDEEAAAEETGEEPKRGPSVLSARALHLIDAVRSRYVGESVETPVLTRVGLKSGPT